MSGSLFDGKTLAVMLGGTAAERSISLESGENVARALEKGGATVLRVDPAEQGWSERLKEASFVFNLLVIKINYLLWSLQMSIFTYYSDVCDPTLWIFKYQNKKPTKGRLFLEALPSYFDKIHSTNVLASPTLAR